MAEGWLKLIIPHTENRHCIPQQFICKPEGRELPDDTTTSDAFPCWNIAGDASSEKLLTGPPAPSLCIVRSYLGGLGEGRGGREGGRVKDFRLPASLIFVRLLEKMRLKWKKVEYGIPKVSAKLRLSRKFCAVNVSDLDEYSRHSQLIRRENHNKEFVTMTPGYWAVLSTY